MLNYILGGLLIISLVLLIVFVCKYRKVINSSIEKINQIYNKHHEELVERSKVTTEVWEQKIKFYEQRARDAEQHFNEMVAHEQQNIDKQLQLYREKEEEKMKFDFLEIADEYKEKTDQLKQEFEKLKEKNNLEVAALNIKINEYQAKYLAIQEEERKKLLLEKEKESHTLQLSEPDKCDIQYLVSIIPNLRHPEILYKLIWTEFLQKPFQDMIKRLFGSDIPKNVIYCIENIETHQKYIGKTAGEVSKRWAEHIKTSLMIGGVSRSKIHDKLFLHWDEFMFSVVEVVDDDKLSDREKFYINLYQSNIYGYNIKG